MWPHSGTSGIITFITNEPFLELQHPINRSFLESSPQTGSNSGGNATLLKHFLQHNYAMLCHVAGIRSVQSPSETLQL